MILCCLLFNNYKFYFLLFAGMFFTILLSAQKITTSGEVNMGLKGKFDGPLGHLTRLQTGKAMRVSSASPNRSSNADNRRILPGKKLVLMNVQGPGMIKHIWLTFPEPSPGWLGKEGNANASELVIRMYWDDSIHPDVESPVGDFFAAGFGQRAEVNSIPVQVSGGDSYNCFWIMPFYKSARIEIENQSEKPSNSFYFQIDYSVEPILPRNTPYFCAQYRQEFPVASGKDYLILDTEGQGQYVGTVFSGRSRSPEWFGEGDEKFYVDGARKPTIQGTGTEDYALNAWGMGKGSYPYFGVPILEGEWASVGWKTTFYRWHIIDPIPFTKSLRVEIEDAGWITEDELKPGVHRGFVERNDDFATVAFWYQTGKTKRFASVLTAKERQLPNLDIIIEGKQLLATSQSSPNTTCSLQKGYYWTGNGQLFFNNESPNDGRNTWLEFEFPVEKVELRQLTVSMTRSNDFGIYRILLDGKVVRSSYDFYNDDIKIVELDLGQHRLSKGPHTLRFECIGKRGESLGSKLGVESVRLRERWNIQRTAPVNL